MHKLATLKQWTDCLEDNHGKRPRHNPAKISGLTMSTAASLASQSSVSPNYGFIFSKDDPYIGIDVDVDPSGQKKGATTTIPPALLFFLQANPTHVHYSPSGFGLHLIYKLSKADCKYVNKLQFKQGACSIDSGALYTGDWRWDRSFLTFTDNLHPSCVDKIKTISFDELSQLLGYEPPETAESKPATVTHIKTGLLISKEPPTLAGLNSFLDEIPATYNDMAKRACSSLGHSIPESNYDYWLLIGQACAHTAIASELMALDTVESIEQAFVKWSAKDPEFVSIDDVQAKFKQLLSSTREKIGAGEYVATYKVLALLARRCRLNFPVLKGKDLIPDSASMKNFTYLMQHEGLTLNLDTIAGGFCISGTEEVVARWFCPMTNYTRPRKAGVSQVVDGSQLAQLLLPYFQSKFKQSVSASHAATATKHLALTSKTSNSFADWVVSEPWDGVERLDKVVHSITYDEDHLDNSELYNSYIYNSLMSMIGIHYWPEDRAKINAMLILTGPQHTYKTSWAEWLLPFNMSNYIASASVDAMIKDDKERDRFLSTCAIVVVNECEPMFTPRYEQKVKAAVDQENVTFRDLYSNTPTSRKRTALVIGTTNKPNLYTGTLGTRKIWQIPVKECDSYLLRDMDLQQLYAEIYHICKTFKEKHPKLPVQDLWKQSAADRKKVESDNYKVKGTMGLDALLVETFGCPVEQEFNMADYTKQLAGYKSSLDLRPGKVGNALTRPNCWTLSNLLSFMRDQYPGDVIDRTKLGYAAANYAAVFTDSKIAVDPFKEYTRADRKIRFGVVSISPSNKLFIFPPLDYEKDDLENINLE